MRISVMKENGVDLPLSDIHHNPNIRWTHTVSNGTYAIIFCDQAVRVLGNGTQVHPNITDIATPWSDAVWDFELTRLVRRA